MDHATWDELRLALALYNGNLATLVARTVDSADPAGSPSPSDSPIPVADSLTTDYRPLVSRFPHGRRHPRNPQPTLNRPPARSLPWT